ncbi:hypothetical protein HDU83_008501 [Entophlyctis luteolus]|nr:hypothetical protein HDU83_008501 [Entophlyctis luteolus]
MVWSVTWIHMNRLGYSTCLQFEADKKKAIALSKKHSIEPQLEAILERFSNKHLIIIDGYAAPAEGHIDVIEYCMFWRSKDRANRRLCVVSSMASRGKSRVTEDVLNNIKEHFVESWSLGDYKSAVENEQFYANISHNLDASNNSHSIQQIPSELVESKLYFAGGSSRFMFDFNTEYVIDLINLSISAVTDVMPYLSNTIGDRSDHVINRLFSCYIDQYTGRRKPFIISEYAATCLAIKEGPSLINRLSAAIRNYRNPSIDGWLLEMWFFASLLKGGVKIYHRNDNHTEVWPESTDIQMIDSSRIPFIPNFPVWFRPIKWNQGGYDAVCFDKPQNRILFVQVTRGDTHSFKIEYFYNLLKAVSESQSSFEIKQLDIAFLVDKEKLQHFRISSVSGEGLLACFPGWTQGTEKEKVKILGISME